MKNNCKHKLSALSFPSSVAKQCIADIFCFIINTYKQQGLVHLVTLEEFNENILKLKDVWKCQHTVVSEGVRIPATSPLGVQPTISSLSRDKTTLRTSSGANACPVDHKEELVHRCGREQKSAPVPVPALCQH